MLIERAGVVGVPVPGVEGSLFRPGQQVLEVRGARSEHYARLLAPARSDGSHVRR